MILWLEQVAFFGKIDGPKGLQRELKERIPLPLFATQAYGTIIGPILTSEHDFRGHLDFQNVAKGVTKWSHKDPEPDAKLDRLL